VPVRRLLHFPMGAALPHPPCFCMRRHSPHSGAHAPLGAPRSAGFTALHRCRVDLVLVGAEAVVESGGVINKLGTYMVGGCGEAGNMRCGGLGVGGAGWCGCVGKRGFGAAEGEGEGRG
jgi:hypothetical protein